ncbi:nucleotidyltransferase [Paenibacillus thermotolerans]|uniref:nucleotidyltransferase n=1 Tax=Paenibacillus thermotolerans TaxID=3027807 RepID=UPI002368D0DD|nr:MULTISPECIES: nucleotidyltransferase [unclassified Paenibacillus]
MGITAGIVVEYNPFHNGHAYHLEETLRATGAEAVVAVMSGNWLQRGEPALVSKRARAEMALAGGADLVIELPVAYSTQPAEWFAYGAVSALHASGIVDALCFGSEAGDIGALYAVAERMSSEPETFKEKLRAQLKSGAPYPLAYAAAVRSLVPNTDADAGSLLSQPNNSLGYHYILSLLRLGSRIKPYTIQRIKAGYAQEHITDESIASATAIRKALFSKEAADSKEALRGIAAFVPKATLDIMIRECEAGKGPVHWESYRIPLLHRLLTATPEQLAAFREVTEGLEHRIKKALSAAARPVTVDSLLEALKTKRYTRTKLQRMLTSIYLEHRKDALTADVLRQGVPYLRVLGFSERGRPLLKKMKEKASVPVLTNVGREHLHPMLQLDVAATAAYSLAYTASTPEHWFEDYYASPVRRSGAAGAESEAESGLPEPRTAED